MYLYTDADNACNVIRLCKAVFVRYRVFKFGARGDTAATTAPAISGLHEHA